MPDRHVEAEIILRWLHDVEAKKNELSISAFSSVRRPFRLNRKPLKIN